MRATLVLLGLPLIGCTNNFGGFQFLDGGTDLSASASDLSSGDLQAPPDLLRVPVAKINHPGNNETRNAALAVPFIGQATDPTDGVLTGGSLVWTSSIDGMIGTGTTFSRMLSVGKHVITLTATDSLGLMGSDAIDLTMQ